MRPSSLSVLGSGGEAGLPAEVERLLRELVADGFVLYCCGPRAAPFALVAAYQWEDYVDLVTIRCFDRVTTARVPAPHHGRVDVFTPEVVVWAYDGPPRRALRALLDLLHPHQHPRAPARGHPAPPSLCVPRAEQRPMTVQFPPPGRAGMRAARADLAAVQIGEPVDAGIGAHHQLVVHLIDGLAQIDPAVAAGAMPIGRHVIAADEFDLAGRNRAKSAISFLR